MLVHLFGIVSKVGRQQLLETAREKFGYHQLRPGQREAIESVIEGRDTLAILPTGAGKSAIYQIPAVLLDGPTVVISPLIALQKDQVQNLQAHDVGGAEILNSHTSNNVKEEALEELKAGNLEFIFLTPEQLSKPEVFRRVQAAKPSLFVVDEAHCISEWGHDFRPDYLKIGDAIEALGHPRVLALTATASEPVRNEIVARLGMREPRMVIQGFDRPNIQLNVVTFPTDQQKMEEVVKRVSWAEGSGIVYVSSRRHAEHLAQELNEHGITALHYHGGLSAKQRNPIQEDFMSGNIRVIVATSAFGMGIDKPDIRFVYHCDIPASLDEYYQEIGRAGRDGEPAEAILFYCTKDLGIHKFFAGGGKLDQNKIELVARAVESKESAATVKELTEETGLSKTKVLKATQRLEEVGVIQCTEEGVTLAPDAPDLTEAATAASDENTRRHEAELFRIERMRAYAEMLDCRRAYLLRYFGEEAPETCSHCDNCEKRERVLAQAATTAAAPPEPEQIYQRKEQHESDAPPFPVKSQVTHKQWGRGMVKKYDGGKVTILFEKIGEKTLAVNFIQEHQLLEAAG